MNKPRLTITDPKELRRQLRDHSYAETAKGQILVIDDPMHALLACYQFIMQVLAGGYEINLLTADGRKKKNYYLMLDLMLPRMHRFYEVYVRGMVYHPAIQIFLNQYRSHPISAVPREHWGSTVLENGMTLAELFVDFIRTIKSEAKIHGTRKKIADHDAKLKKNLKQLRKWERELFRRCSRPVIIRLDLEYLAALLTEDEETGFNRDAALMRFDNEALYLSKEDPIQGWPLPPMKVGFEEVQSDRAKLFDNMRSKPSLFEHLVGYAWRIEYAPDTGFHLHVLLAFKGSEIHKHEWLSLEICRYWDNEITKGRGRSHSCNADWDKDAKGYGIGAMEWHDELHRENLREGVLPYLAKFDQYILVRPYKGAKLMGTGFFHREEPTKRGRPRNEGRQQPQPPAP